MLNEGTLSTACELTMLILSISVTFSGTHFTVAFLITKSCQQCSPIDSSLWSVVVDFRVHLVAVYFCLQQCKNY